MFAQKGAKSQLWEAKKSCDPSFIGTITLKPFQEVLYLLLEEGREQIG